MTRLPLSIKNRAEKLRKIGYSLGEISNKLSISKSTISLWSKNIKLNKVAQQRLKRLGILGQYKTILLKKVKREKLLTYLEKQALQTLKYVSLDIHLSKIICSLIYFCEGIKSTDTLVTFINSDPTLVNLFLSLFRKAFKIDEKKFRILMHLHNYHLERKQKEYWSRITHIDNKQFIKTYWKPNTGKRIKTNYQGCLSIRYYDAIIAKELLALYRITAKTWSYK